MSTTVTAAAWMPATPEDVFAFFDDPDSVLEFNPAAVRIESLERGPEERYVADIAMRGRGGRTFILHSEQTLREPPLRMTIRASGPGLTTEQHREFRRDGNGTAVTVTVTLTYERAVLGKVLEILQRGQVQIELEATLLEIAERLANRPRSGSS